MPARPEAGDEEMEGILYLLQEFKGKVVLFGISDVVDIAIMAFLIYKVIMLMRRTNSGAVAKGVLLLLFALGVSTFFHLNTVSYLLQQLMVCGVVALVVIFQPEIRRFLEQMGRTSLGKVFTPEEARNELDSAITQTADAYMSLSKSKTGALMVFERKNMLDDAIKTGTALDCTVNAELLKNIFWNKAPLHDGAALLRRQDLAFSAHFPGHEHALLAKQKYALTPFFPWPDRMEQGVYSVVTLNRHIKIAHEDST